MKNPNGFGSVHKLTGNRRNPYRARKTIGWDENGKQLYQAIGYYKSRQLAIQALAEFNANPYDIKTDSITFAEVYEKWSEEHFQNIVPSAIRTWKSAYNHCGSLHTMRFKDIKTMTLEETIKNAVVGNSTKARMKSMFNLIYKYALKHEICDKDYAFLCNTVKKGKPKIERVPFNKNEIKILWDNINLPFVDMILIGIYSGWRPQELAILKTLDIDINNRTMLGGLKTDAGKNRIVPIHSKVFPLIQNRYNENNEHLFVVLNGQQGNSMTYDKYRLRFKKVMEMLNMNHRPHDTRHTFITLAKEYNFNEYILKLIVGHSIVDITEKIYTHRTISQLKEEIEKIAYFF
ncbi:tyrosine-type recombinase/integrase [Clostridium sp. CF012]|uniref:tyrosine-type recombinase/integrase n=1 Tax=Clostridium sp. CF012 TaxID=2843319 RepID=UPI001C0AC2D1|nr:tyrosine-type recombinase/integrase [Clostridium sp. CF012]MBU3145765.1 tyrosine-type recombinase/integrase [Clostridium sp. CF012]